ncbi:hypothetical protein, partial [Hymenobacter sp. UYP22]|uniref:hypothetical protein n=1 Tax=Hymenobacter sp. UYP22 TaxID=3156348 RepID=UPI00339788B5
MKRAEEMSLTNTRNSVVLGKVPRQYRPAQQRQNHHYSEVGGRTYIMSINFSKNISLPSFLQSLQVVQHSAFLITQ